jgi:hypothetical protein
MFHFRFVSFRYRHDLESVLGVLMRITTYDNGVISISGSHHFWLNESISVCRDVKELKA